MILKVRIDDRLLHGQVAYSWKAKLAYNAVVIISEEASKDDLRKATIKMCCPEGVKLAVRDIAKGVELLKNEKLKNMKVFVICPDPKTVLQVLAGISEKPVVNLGGMQMKDGTTLFSKAVYLSENDLKDLDQIEALGYNIEVQEVPETTMLQYKNLRSKNSK